MGAKSKIVRVGMKVIDELYSQFGDDLKKIAFNYITDSVESILVGKRSLDEWAEIVVEAIDNIKDRTIEENNYNYIGGNLKFSISKKISSKVIIEYELYFRDSEGNYFKNSAKSDVNQDNFIKEDIETIKKSTEVIYEIEE